MAFSSSQQTTIAISVPHLIVECQGQNIRLDLVSQRHVLGRDRSLGADLVVPVDWDVISRYHATLCREEENYRIYDGDGQRPSTNGIFYNRTRVTPSEGLLLRDGMELRIGQDPANQASVTYRSPNRARPVQLPERRSILLKGRSVELGRGDTATLELPAPIVSRRHATIEANGQGVYVLRDYSTNGTFANGKRVRGSVLLSEGATIRIGPFSLVLRGDELALQDLGDRIRLDADRLVVQVGKKRLLKQVTLTIEPGQFVALVGGSGAGKSTLMRTLLGIQPLAGGTVYLNGDDLRRNFNIYRTQIGYVPQDDIIHRNLTVGEVLANAAKLRLPPDTDVEAVVRKTLQEIEMVDRRDTFVKNLSGGQRKRASIGVELLVDPKLFFLDEPTSGLDPGLDKKMMQLLRQLADRGRTIVLVTHATANVRLCDRIAFMGRVGHLCYFGPPDEVDRFFNIQTGDFADIYNALEQKEAEVAQRAEAFHNSEWYRKYVRDRLSLGQATQRKAFPQQAKPSFLRQLLLLARRTSFLMWRDKVNLALALLTAPVGIALITLAVRDKDPLAFTPDDPSLAPLALRVLFVFTCACIWVGLSSSLQEIIKESAIYLRERLVNLGLFAYIGSKVLVLGGLAIAQTWLMGITILIGFDPPEPELISWPVGLAATTLLTLFACTSLGLLISASVKNSSQANSALPLVLLPQIIFSGVLFKMEGLASKLSWLMLSRWSVGAYGAIVDVNTMVPDPTELPDGSFVDRPFEPSAVYDPTWENLALNWGVLLLHGSIYLGLTLWQQKRKDLL